LGELASSDYEGWSVLMRDGSRLYESNPWNPKLAQLHRTAYHLPIRREDRQTMAWDDVPQRDIMQLEVYFARHLGGEQPACLIQRGCETLRFIQFKMGAIVVGSGAREADPMRGQHRQGIFGYKVGYWNWKLQEAQLYIITAKGVETLPKVVHPCWPRPMGYGIGAQYVGLSEDQVPPVPTANPLVVPAT
jgi:hypothetical protein